jgi:hypothetical protein
MRRKSYASEIPNPLLPFCLCPTAAFVGCFSTLDAIYEQRLNAQSCRQHPKTFVPVTGFGYRAELLTVRHSAAKLATTTKTPCREDK